MTDQRVLDYEEITERPDWYCGRCGHRAEEPFELHNCMSWEVQIEKLIPTEEERQEAIKRMVKIIRKNNKLIKERDDN